MQCNGRILCEKLFRQVKKKCAGFNFYRGRSDVALSLEAD